MAPRKTGAAVRVRILPARAVVIDGSTRHEGWEGDVPAEDAETLIAEGYVERASKAAPKVPKPTRPKRTPRKPLTIRAIEDGEAERG